ncbi:hypothetical protein ACVBEF_06105 [Glaciimonas sp. GG7]
MTYLKDAFKRHGLPESAIHKRIAAKIIDTRKMDGLDILLRPKQLQPIEYYTSWTPLEMATGENLKEVKKYAGEMAANRGRYVIFWPDSYKRSLQNIITQKENGIWSAYTEFMMKSLDSGPLVDQAKTNIDAMVAGILMDYYKNFPKIALNIDNLKQHIRRVSYQGVDVADVFAGPGRIAGTNVLFSMTNVFPPTIIDATGASLLRKPLFQNAIRQGLPLKMVASLGESLFIPYTKGRTYHRLVIPYLTFSGPGKARDMLWIAYKEKFKSDIDFSIFSPTEQNQMLAMGLTKSTIKAATMVFGPALSPWMLNAVSAVAAMPDALAATVVDDPKEMQAYIRHFLRGILINSIGGVAYVGNRILIKLEVSKATATLMADPAKKNFEIAKLLKWAKEKIPIAAPKSANANVSPTRPATAVTGNFLKRSISKESTVMPLSVTLDTQMTDAIDTPLPTTPTSPTSISPARDALSAEQKVIITLTYMIARAEILSYKESAALIKDWDAAITATLTIASSKPPKDQFDTLSPAAQKFSALKYALIHQGNTLNHTEARTFVKEKYGQPITPEVVDMVYFYALEPWLQKQANDTCLNRRALEHPSDILRSALALNTAKRITVFLDSLEENVLFKSTVDSMRSHPAPSMPSEILAFSSRQMDTFLIYFDETALPQPGYLLPQAMLHEYRRRLAFGQGWHFNHRSPIANILADYKRTLGIDQVITPIALQVLNKLNYYDHDRMALPGFEERYLGGLRNEDKLKDIPGYRLFNDQQKLTVFKTISAITGIPMDRPLSSFLASAARVLTLFADPADLTKMNYTGGENVLLNQLIGLDLAASNNVGEIDQEWSVTFWELMNSRRDIPGVALWLYKLKYKHYQRDRDLTIATINSLYKMAKAQPGSGITPQMIELAIQLAQNTLIPFIDGDSPQTRTQAINDYLTHVMGEQVQPQSPQEWRDFLETEPTSWEIPSNASAIAGPSQPAVTPTSATNAMLARAIKKLGSEMFPGAIQSQPLSHAKVKEDPLAVARLLVQSGVKGITTIINGVTYPIEMIINTHPAATIYQDQGV